MKILIVALAAFSFTAFARVPIKKGMIEIPGGQKLYTEHDEAAGDKPTIVFANGLTWSTAEWEPLVTALKKIDPELGFFRYDMQGMGNTIMLGPRLDRGVKVEEQVFDLFALTKAAGIKGRIILVGLSYGGAVSLSSLAIAGKKFDDVIAIAPFLARLSEQDELIHKSVRNHRALYPWDLRPYDAIYDQYLYILVNSTYPYLEPQLRGKQRWIDGVFHLVQGAKDFVAMDLVSKLPRGRLHLVGAVDDEFVTDKELIAFANAIKGKYESYLRVLRSKHKIPHEHPEFLAKWIYQIVIRNPDLHRKLDFIGDPKTGEVRSGQVEIPLFKKAGSCADGIL